MRKRVSILVAVLAVVAFANVASAQIPQSDCNLGVYADAAGTIRQLEPTQGQPFTVHVVMYLEGLVTGVAFDLLVPQLGNELFLIGESFGPVGNGINIVSPGGYNIGIGECAVGFGGLPILVSSHTFLMPGEVTSARTISLAPNLDSDPEAPIFSVCTGQIYVCTISNNLLLTAPITTEDTSFGAVKSLYAN